ncbi:hypothetical protein KCV07_g8487, partial [Aureobasidium melanogenum]
MDDDQVITPTGADQNDEVVTTTDTTTSTTTAAQPRRSQRLIESQRDQAATLHVGARLPRAPRAPRPIDPVRRRKKAWPFKWETWRIEAVATQLSMSDPEAVERLRTTRLDDLWKSDPQQASLYEDALEVYDERARADQLDAIPSPEAGPSAQNNNMASPEAGAINSESTVSAPETQITFNGRPVASADLEAAMTLMSLRYGGNTQDYINYGASESSMGLQAFSSADAPTVTTSKSMPLDGIFETPVPNVTSKRALSPLRIPQASDVPGISTRWKGKQPVTYTLSTYSRFSGAGLRVPAANDSQTVALSTSPKTDGTFDSNLKHANNISKALSTVSRVVKPPTRSTKPTSITVPATSKPRSSRTSIISKDVNKTLEQHTTLRRSKRKIIHDSENEDDVVDLTGHDRPASSKKPKASYKKQKTTEESPMLLRSKREVMRIEEDEKDHSSSEEVITKSNMALDGEVTQQRTLRRRSTRRIVHDSDDEAETFSTDIKNTAGPKKAKSEEVEKSPVLRRTKRKLTRIDEDEDDDFSLLDDDLPTLKRSKKSVKKTKKTAVDDFDDSSLEDGRPASKSCKKAIDKSNKTFTEEDEDDDEDEEELDIVKKPKQATKKATLTLVHPPANLPLKAPDNTPGIPDGALALNEHFKKDAPCPLGVQLPINRTRTRWEWIPYNTRKVSNANFDWTDDQQRKDANRFRQQRIRRRLTEHGYIHDGRKNH